MEKIVDTKWSRTDTFEKVDEVPGGYEVWAIGRHNFEHPRCLPLCKTIVPHQADLSSLKYIEVESEELALKLLDEAVQHGCDKERFYEIVSEYNKSIN